MATNLTALEHHDRPPLLNVSELAAFLNVKPRTIYEVVAQNRIPYRKPPGSNICDSISTRSSHGPKQEITNDDRSWRCYYAAILFGGCNLKENECRSLKLRTRVERSATVLLPRSCNERAVSEDCPVSSHEMGRRTSRNQSQAGDF
jgi:excisionase family DNA binding protein